MTNIQPETLKTLRLDALGQINQGKKRKHSFNVDFSEINPDFVGRFVVHHPSQMERLQIGVIISQLLGGTLNVDTMTYNIDMIVATLDTVVEESPNWFNPHRDDLDYDILESVYLEYTNWLNSFRKNTKGVRPEGDSTDGPSEVRVVDTE